jgi:hypothetical protein
MRAKNQRRKMCEKCHEEEAMDKCFIDDLQVCITCFEKEQGDCGEWSEDWREEPEDINKFIETQEAERQENFCN